ncbi:MAG TPA: stage III sporulation protein AD [Candidatus Avamphibacillus intestinigallinarum]|nr:stage III sporulation protein AD [Candidatus Avamphibacillus intestinigallinarum]
MDITQIVLIGLVVSILFIILKDVNPAFAYFLVLCTGVLLFFMIMQQIVAVFQVVEKLGEKAHIESVYITTILKVIGIAYIAELGVHFTKDAGLDSIAAKIELAGKITILMLAIPIIQAVMETILGFLPSS